MGEYGCLAVSYTARRIVAMKHDALDMSKPDEYLYGRAGYLFTLMFLRKELGPTSIDTSLISEVSTLHVPSIFGRVPRC